MTDTVMTNPKQTHIPNPQFFLKGSQTSLLPNGLQRPIVINPAPWINDSGAIQMFYLLTYVQKQPDN